MDTHSVLPKALAACRPAFVGVALFSACINVLALAGSLYMLQIYDRVLMSRSLGTLVGLSLMVLVAYLLQGALEAIRSRMLARIGARFDELVSEPTYDFVARLPFVHPDALDRFQPMRSLDHIRGFLGGLGPTALFDMPFMPLFLAGCFLLHPWLGWLALAGAGVIVGLTLLTEARSRTPASDVSRAQGERQAMLDATRRNAEIVRALGMGEGLRSRFAAANQRLVASGLRASDVAASIGSGAKTFRFVLQSAALGLGAYLVILGELSGGAMIATSILMSRALAPIEVAVAHWRGFVAARRGYENLRQAFQTLPSEATRLGLPTPRSDLAISGAFVATPGGRVVVAHDVTFKLSAGQALGLIGPSASGKSSLARALVGVWPTLRGDIRLDGAALNQWPQADLGRHIGYLPQDVELFDGTIAENIARFQRGAAHGDIVAAAREAGAHDMIVRLPDGYNTRVGEGGAAISGGQRQRVALARALFGDPFLVVLDEPNAHLDAAGDAALISAVGSVRRRGGVVVLITHRPSALQSVDLVSVMDAGRLRALGPRDEVLKSLVSPETVVPFKAPAVAAQGRP